MKSRINVTVDQDLHLYLMNKGEKISGIVNEMLRQYTQIDNENTGQLQELENELHDVNQKIGELDKKRADLSMKIAMIKNKQQQEQEQQWENVESVHQSVMNSGQWQDLV